MGGVVGLSLAFCIQGCRIDPGPSRWIFKKPTVAMSHVKDPLECPFGLGALGKIKFLSSILHRQSSRASLWGGSWASKLLAAIGIAYMLPKIKKVIPAPGEWTRSAKVKNTNTQPH
ncbi:hypothetical protein TNCV_4660091 [Trichonephila clavipes]|uniref:Uncharacterized protein n=1 Tax=Trichonephila clavipes TaxID=2585209 RepID=A0A8X6S970_TRICX|nr:hypothetical protein TNCV_4660091 [Trichonephila clavipes]